VRKLFLISLTAFAIKAGDQIVIERTNDVWLKYDKTKKILTAYRGGFRPGLHGYCDTFVIRNLVDRREKIDCTVDPLMNGLRRFNATASALDVKYLRFWLDMFEKKLDTK